ncbi:MAG: ComEC/Rec2 family competence protein [Bacteroidales bacterium]
MNLPTIHQMPFLRFLLPLIVGIVVFNSFPSLWIGGVSLILSLLFFSIFFLYNKGKHAFRTRHLFGVGVAFAFVGIGVGLTYLQSKQSEFDFPKEKAVYSVEVKSVPQEKDRSIYCQLETSSNKKIIAYLHKDLRSLSLKQGDHLYIYSEARELKNANRPSGFDFTTYMKRQGFAATIYVDSAFWKKTSQVRSFNLTYLAMDLREKILEIFRSFGFRENEFALLSGITIGYQDALTTEQKSNFSAVGLSHLMAVSGMQTAMIYAMLWFLLGFIPKNSRYYRVKYATVILILWIFTFVTGLSASVVRASIMLSVMMVGGLFKRQAITLNSMMFAALCILFYNPFALYDIGFQLSFMAVIAIMFSQDLLRDRLDRMKTIPRYFAELISMTLAAQLGTSPLSIYYFHQFPLLFLFANLIILPFNGILVYLACLCTFLAAINLPHAWFDVVLQTMLSALDKTTDWLSAIPYAQIKELNPPTITIVLFYVLLTLLLLFVYQKRFRLAIYSLGITLSMLVVLTYYKVEERNQNKLLIYNEFGKNRIEYVFKGKREILDVKQKAFVFEGKRIFVLDKDIKHTTSKQPLLCDILVLAKGFKGTKEDIERMIQSKLVVLDASMSPYYREKLRSELTNYYDMSEMGAYILAM